MLELFWSKTPCMISVLRGCRVSPHEPIRISLVADYSVAILA